MLEKRQRIGAAASKRLTGRVQGTSTALTAKVAGTQAPHGIFRLHAQGGQRFVEFFSVGSDVVNSGFRGAIVPNLIKPLIHIRDEDVQVLDVGQDLFFLTTG